jgi:hypothetical protein
MSIQKGICIAKLKGMDEEEALKRANLSQDDFDMWQQKRFFIGKCGFELDDKITRWHGWYKSYLEGNEVKFMTTAPAEKRNYIPLDAWLNWLKEAEQESIEDEYYNTAGMVNKVSRHVWTPSKRRDEVAR